jgi:trehalose 6-phosphate synthase
VSVPGLSVELLALDREAHRLHYDVISNQVLWFCFHGLFDSSRDPVFDAALHDAWDAYRAINRTFAEAVAESAAEGDVVLVQDLQLLLVAGELAELRPDLAVTHFTHTPFGSPSELAMLPDTVADEIFSSLTAAPAGFHTDHWVHAFRLCVHERGNREGAGAFATTFGPDAPSLHEVGTSDAAIAARHHLADRIGDRRCIVRADRLELSKNIVRGFLAFDELLETRPAWLVKGTSCRSMPMKLAGRAPSRGTAPLKNGKMSSRPTIVPTYPTAVLAPERRPCSSGGTSSGIIAL